MTENQAANPSARIYRVDKFMVPPRARAEFMGKISAAHTLLGTLPGFLQDFILEQSAGPGEFNFVTIVEWKSSESIENAKTAVMALFEKMNFNPQEMFARLVIKADLANYRRVDIQ